MQIKFEENQKRAIHLTLDSLKFGDGNYVFSCAIFRGAVDEKLRYDLVTYDFEFQVVGNEPYNTATIFHHPGKWDLLPANNDELY